MQRELDRATEKLRADIARLHALAPGGAPEHPVELASASQVEPDVELRRCGYCQGSLVCDEHEVTAHGGRRLRRARATCRGCHARWTFFYAVGGLIN